MKTANAQQEILLVTTSTFSKREWCKRDEGDGSRQQSHAEQLEEACWNGLLREMLPEVLEQADADKSLLLWHIRQGKTFLQIELSQMPPHLEAVFSIDANLFVPTLNYN